MVCTFGRTGPAWSAVRPEKGDSSGFGTQASQFRDDGSDREERFDKRVYGVGGIANGKINVATAPGRSARFSRVSDPEWASAI